MRLRKIKALLKDLLPPLLLRWLGTFFRVHWSGHYPSWASAAAKCTGYNTPLIFEKVRAALLQVKTGEAAGERDSMVFDQIQYAYPLLAALNYAARRNGNRLNVLDFGGSLGTSYFQNRGMLAGLDEFHWCVVEQKHFAEEGRRTFADTHLHFYDSLDEAFTGYPIHFVLLSSSLQYLEHPLRAVV